MISLPVFCIFVATFAFVWYLNKNKSKKGQKEIPGPRSYPIIGNGLQLAGKQVHLQLNKWSEQYGEIYKIKFGSQNVVLVTNMKTVKEIMNDPNYVGRPHFEGFDMYEDVGERLGIVNSQGELWEVHRRFLLRQLRDFGFGKSSMENLIIEELNEVIALFKSNEGKPIGNIKKTLTLAVINSLWTVLSSHRFPHDDPNLLKLVENTNKVISDVFEGASLLLFMPWLRHIIPEYSGYNAFRRVLDEIREFFEGNIAEHKKTFQEDNLRDFIDVYLAEVKKTTDPKSKFYGKDAERQLVMILADLFFAGSDTTSTTLSWAMLYLAKFPSVQKKFQEEIAMISNNSRNVSLEDRPNMPYTIALIDEILRFSSIVPDGVQHTALEDKEFQGYFIPKGTWIMPNMHYIHHDPKIWGDPENFRPERFIVDGKYKKSEYLIPFQIGRRQCVGETLARDTIFLYLTNIFQRFDVRFDPDLPEPTTDPKPGILIQPMPYNIIMKDRLEN